MVQQSQTVIISFMQKLWTISVTPTTPMPYHAQPCSFFLQMNILIASSRGGGLDRHVEPHIRIMSYVYPGINNINRVTQVAKHRIPPPYLNTTPTHVYLLTGIPDITQKIKGGHTTNHTPNAYTQESHQSLYPTSKTNSTNSKKQWNTKRQLPSSAQSPAWT